MSKKVRSKEKVTIFEVGPRDGLQNEKRTLPLQDKVWLIESLARAGVKNIETGALVRTDKVPQMADSDVLHDQLSGMNANYWYLVPNEKGLERAISKGIKNIALFTAVSDTFNQKNIGMSVSDSFKEMKKIVSVARANKMFVRGYISTVWGCPFEGRIPAQKAVKTIAKMLSLGVDQVSVGDTIGVASPSQVRTVLEPIVEELDDLTEHYLAVHFHDTRGTALANAFASYVLGVKTFDSSLGGLGGCPFAPGAAGNLATEDLVYFFKEMGVETGINYRALCETSLELSQRMNRPVTSKALQAYVANCEKNPIWDT